MALLRVRLLCWRTGPRAAVRGSVSVLVRLLTKLVSGGSARRPVAMSVFPHHPNAEKRA
jgi:hypothetical protein